MCQKLQVLGQTIYSRWFNQFEFPDEDNKPYKSNGGKFVYNEELKKDIPIGWRVTNITNIINWESSSQPPKESFIYKYKNGYIRFIQNRDYDNSNYITYIPKTNTTKICTKYDIMIDKYGDAGRIRYGLVGAYNVALAKINPIIDDTQEYIRSYLNQDGVYTYLHNACIASTRASLNEEILKGLNLYIPNNKVLKEYENIMKTIINQILLINENTRLLNIQKETLLPLLINGQLV